MINKKLRAAIIGANSYIARNLIYKIRNDYSKLFKLELYDRHEKHADNVEPYHKIDLLDVQTFSSVNYDCDLLYVFAGKTGTAQGFDDCDLLRYRRKIFAKGVREYTEKILSHIPKLYPDIEVVKLNIQEDHVHMVVIDISQNCHRFKMPPAWVITNR